MRRRDLVLRARALLRRGQVDCDLDEELAFHIDREVEKLVAQGVAREEARWQARARFGSRTAVADECRDERGIGVIESLLQDVRYAWRAFRRAPGAALTIVVTMTLGLGLATTVFSVFNAVFLRVDNVSRPNDLFAVRLMVNSRAWAPFTLGEYEGFRRDVDVFAGMAAVSGDSGVRVDGRLTRSRLVSGEFFQLLGVAPAQGRVLTPADDHPDAAPALVLSDRGWAKLFGRDQGAIGRHIRVNGVEAEIVGIMREGLFGLSAVPPDFWGPLSAMTQFNPAAVGKEATTAVEVVGRLKPGLSTVAALDALKRWAAGPGLTLAGNRPVSIALRPSTGVTPEALDALGAFVPLFFAFGLVVLIGCANVANMLLARGLARQQEIGIRLSLGASRLRIARQLLTESLLLASVAAAVAYPAARVFMQGTLSVVAIYSPPEMAEQLNAVIPSLDWHVLAFLAVSAVVVTALFGIVPALHATRLDPVRTMRGEVIRDARPSRVRHLLITAQVAASALLLIPTALLVRGALEAAATDPGLRVRDTVIVAFSDEARRPAILDAVTADPLIAMVSAASPPDSRRFTTARALSTSISKPLTYAFASRDFFDVMGIGVMRGRGFLETERTPDAAVVLVSARTAARLWPDRDALGQALRLHFDTTAVEVYTVVGVVRTIPAPNGLMTAPAGADVYVPAHPGTPGTQLALRVRDDPFRARTRLLDRLTAVDPSLGSVMTLRTMVSVMAFVMRALSAIGLTVAALALLLTVSGLVSVLSYMVEQRTRELGVRIALGASAAAVVRLVFVESARPVAIGLAAGALFAAAVTGALMASPLASAVNTVVHVFDPSAYLASLLVIVLACGGAAAMPALRAARVNPSTTLRRD